MAKNAPNKLIFGQNMYFYGFYQFLKGFWKILKIGRFLAEKWSFSAYFANFNYRFLKIYKIECLEPHGGPNKLNIRMDSFWGILKKIIYPIFDILIFRDFLAPEKCKIGKNRLKMAIFELSGAKKSRKIKISKIW